MDSRGRCGEFDRTSASGLAPHQRGGGRMAGRISDGSDAIMVTIHTPGDGHVAPSPDPDGTKWDPYSDEKTKHTLERALFILRHNVRNMRPCDDCFKRLDGGRTFTEVFDDANVFISFDPTGPASGATN